MARESNCVDGISCCAVVTPLGTGFRDEMHSVIWFCGQNIPPTPTSTHHIHSWQMYMAIECTVRPCTSRTNANVAGLKEIILGHRSNMRENAGYIILRKWKFLFVIDRECKSRISTATGFWIRTKVGQIHQLARGLCWQWSKWTQFKVVMTHLHFKTMATLLLSWFARLYSLKRGVYWAHTNGWEIKELCLLSTQCVVRRRTKAQCEDW